MDAKQRLQDLNKMGGIMFNQYTTVHETEAGTMRIERTYKTDALQLQTLDSILVNVAGREFELPKSMHQTDRTIIRKVCSIIRTINKGVSK